MYGSASAHGPSQALPSLSFLYGNPGGGHGGPALYYKTTRTLLGTDPETLVCPGATYRLLSYSITDLYNIQYCHIVFYVTMASDDTSYE
jgi:hypothetical protein